MSIACALRWGVASVEITLLGMARPIREKHFKCGIYASGRLSFDKGEESRLLAFIIPFVKFLDQTSSSMYLYVKEL